VTKTSFYTTLPPQDTSPNTDEIKSPAAETQTTKSNLDLLEDELNEEEFSHFSRRKHHQTAKEQEAEAIKSHPFYNGKAVKMFEKINNSCYFKRLI
jgi:hypothetical protein